MIYLLIFYLFYIYGSFASRFAINDGSKPRGPPVFPKTYITKATMFIPYAEIMEPFTAYYDVEAGASRIDYYGDMVKTYQIMKNESFGVMMKIAPVTTESSLNVKTCLEVSGTTEMGPITIQTVVPDLRHYKYTGNETVRQISTEKWQHIEKFGEVTNKYTMFVTYKKSSRNSDVLVAIPVKYVMKGVNNIFGSHFDHYWIEYDSDSFTDEKPDPIVFQVTGIKCQPFPGPGIDHLYTFNPIKEFMETGTDQWNFRFDYYKKQYGKDYHLEEEAERKLIFKNNVRFINSHNRANRGYTLAANHLVDRTSIEIRALLGRQRTSEYNGGQPFPYDINKESKDIPESFDWRLYGAVNSVKDQSVCGSCWSFGTTGAIEGGYFVHSGILLRLSQQALIDCSWGFQNNGCDGGEDFRSYQWMMKHGGIPTEDEYGPYLGQDGYCHVDSKTSLVAPITGYVNVTSGHENALKIALLKHGPISVSIYASLKTFAFYHNGVYYDPECKSGLDDLNHAVLLVGFGKLYGKDYWLVKNSWSNRWGNDGYILMSPTGNNCGVMTTPTYVTFK